jgi:hypothetical protein
MEVQAAVLELVVQIEEFAGELGIPRERRGRIIY